MEASLEQLKRLADESEGARREVMLNVQKLAYELESPQDTIHRYGHMVELAAHLC